MTRHPRSLLSLLVALAAIAGCADKSDRPLELKFGHVGAPGSLFAASAEEFARLANERLGDRATVVIFGASQLGGDEVLLQKLRLGTVDFALPSTIMSSTFAEFGLFEMPYLVEDRDHMGRIEEEILWPTLRPIVNRAGLRHHRRVGKRFSPRHEQRSADRNAGRPGWRETQNAPRHLARQDVSDFRRQSDTHAVIGGIRRAADRGDGRPGESASADRELKVS